MANINHVGDLTLGKMLKIFSTKGIYNNFSSNTALWDFINQIRTKNKPEGREVRFAVRTAPGYAAAGFLAPGAAGSFRSASQSTVQEGIAYFKDYAVTVDVDRHLLNKSGSELAAYGQPLADELDAKGLAMARVLSTRLCGDGSGAIGKAAALAASSNLLRVTVSVATADAGRSNPGWFLEGDEVVGCDPDGTVKVKVNGNSNTITHFKVSSVDIANNYVYLQAFNGTSSVNVTSVSGTTDVEANDYFYRLNESYPDLSGAITDYGALSYVWAGLESFGAADGRTVNGLVMSGALAGSQYDASAAIIDKTHFQEALSLVKRRAGKKDYKWTKAFMHDNVLDAMMESWESLRSVISAKDNKFGTEGLGYVHGKDVVEFMDDEFVPKARIWILPEAANKDKKPLQFIGTPIEPVEVDGVSKFMPNDSSGNHKRAIRSYLEGSGMTLCQHPAAILSIVNFTY